jgi:hypothetical protein
VKAGQLSALAGIAERIFMCKPSIPKLLVAFLALFLDAGFSLSSRQELNAQSSQQAILEQQGATESAILEVRPVVFPAYDSYQGISRYAPTPDDYARAIADPGFVMERVTYRSDDLDVYAYLYRPIVLPKDEELPVVIFNRGSRGADVCQPSGKAGLCRSCTHVARERQRAWSRRDGRSRPS